MKLRANRRKARCSGSPTEVDDRSSSSPFSSSLTLCRTLPASGSLSLPPFAVPPPPSRASTLLIYLPICLSGYLRRRAGPPSLSHPHIARPARSRRARARYSEIVWVDIAVRLHEGSTTREWNACVDPFVYPPCTPHLSFRIESPWGMNGVFKGLRIKSDARNFGLLSSF